MEYYFTPKQYISGTSLTIVDDEAKHLGRVLRKQSGEEIYVTDGEGNLYKTKITGMTKGVIDCSVTEKFHNLNEPAARVTLYQSLIKNPDRFEFVIEKSVELGVHRVRPVITENVINKTSNKTERWQSIALSAMKQSQRCFLPKVNEPISFKEAIESSKHGIKLIAHEKLTDNLETPPLRSFNEKGLDGEVSLFIGPEGGFTDVEISFALSHGFKILNLGARKYRSETAAILGVGLLLAS
jgi:16S rRNA (uracil1498-N3)-methyltransferase